MERGTEREHTHTAKSRDARVQEGEAHNTPCGFVCGLRNKATKKLGGSIDGFALVDRFTAPQCSGRVLSYYSIPYS